jgi:hypothetical protein
MNVRLILIFAALAIVFFKRKALSNWLMKFKTFNIIDKSYWYYLSLVCGLVFLLIFYRYKFDGINLQDKLYNYLDPIASLMAFITTLFIFIMQAKQKWENSIEKRLTVKYIFVGVDGDISDDAEIAHVIDAYLPSESDARAWAQSLGQQMMGFLDFDMHWDEKTPKIEFNTKLGKFVKRYFLQVYLTTDPRVVQVTKKEKETDEEKKKEQKLPIPNDKFENFKNKKFRHSEIIPNANNNSITWQEKF